MGREADWVGLSGALHVGLGLRVEVRLSVCRTECVQVTLWERDWVETLMVLGEALRAGVPVRLRETLRDEEGVCEHVLWGLPEDVADGDGVLVGVPEAVRELDLCHEAEPVGLRLQVLEMVGVELPVTEGVAETLGVGDSVADAERVDEAGLGVRRAVEVQVRVAVVVVLGVGVAEELQVQLVVAEDTTVREGLGLQLGVGVGLRLGGILSEAVDEPVLDSVRTGVCVVVSVWVGVCDAVRALERVQDVVKVRLRV